MKTCGTIIAALAMLSANCTAAAAQFERPTGELQEKAQALADLAIKEGMQGALQFCAFKDGKCIVDVWAGTMTTNAGAATIDGNTLFPIFSTEKPFLATAVHRSVERGKLEYDRPISDYWPKFRGGGKERLLVREVLGYRSGLPDVKPGMGFDLKSIDSMADWKGMLDWYASCKPDIVPGTKQRYMPKSYGWALGGLLENVWGRPANEILREQVLVPAGIENDFFFVCGDDEIARIATVYKSMAFETMNNDVARRSFLPSSWAVSSARGIAKFYNRLCGFDGRPPLVRKETLDAALRPCRHESDPVPDAEGLKKWHMIFGMGYGLWGEADNISRVFGHGGIGGSEGLCDRSQRLVVGYTCNFDNAPPKLREAFYSLVGMRWRYWKDDVNIQDLQMQTVSAATDADIVIYGSTPAAISAAIQARRMGAKAVVVSPETRIGGLTTGGLGQTDIGIKSAFGGIALEFYKAVAAWYADPAHWKYGKAEEYFPDGQCAGTRDRDSMWTFEPSAALAILEGWEKRDGLDIRRGEWLDRRGGIEKKDGKIVAIKSLSGKVYRGKVFIDATYEGDLMAAAGVSYHVGRESRSTYGETVAGNVPDAIGEDHHNFHRGVSPYVVEGDARSGLLPGVEPHNPSERPGDGDSRVQAYCFRMCLTDVPENRIPFKKPDGYDERDYELLFREYAAMAKEPAVRVAGCLDGKNPIPFIMSRMPNGKTDSNNRTGFSSDFIGGNWDWPDASYEEREKIFRRHLDYQRGLMWTLANHPRIPANVRGYFSKWGTCRDEFHDGPGDGWQSQLYVREARRMVGEAVMTELHCRGLRTSKRPVALAAFGMDSHHVRRIETAEGFVRNEGNFEDARSADMKTRMAAWGIDYGAIVPKRGECKNLIVPVCVSASHAAFGSIRMEPVFFALGQAAGTAAVLAGEGGCAVQDVDYAALVRRLSADGQALPASVKFFSGMSPIVPVKYRQLGGVDATCLELRRINAATGLRRFFLTGPGFNDVMFGPFPGDLYAKIGADVAAVKRGLADTDIEVSWWCSPSIRYFSDFPSIEDCLGNTSKDNKKCPLDESFAADYAAKVQSVARARPTMICIEDDYTLTWGRGLEGGACYCKRHLADFAKRYGKALSATEIADAFRNRTAGNLAIRRAFSDTMRESLVSLARKVRAAVDEVDPTIRIMLCEPWQYEKNGDNAVEAVVRAFAGGTRPAVRPSGAIYGAETTPASIPGPLSRTVWTLERMPPDIETFYEADVYPHNRFYSSASQLMSLMAGAAMAGADDYLFYCLQYLDDPLEDPGYANAYLALKPRIDAVRCFIRERDARLSGVRTYWRQEDFSLTRGIGYSHGDQLSWGAYMLAKFGIPYTTRPDGGGPVLLLGDVAETMEDGEIRELLSGGVLMDAPAAVLLAKRGFGGLLGADVTEIEGRPRIVDERIRPEACCKKRGSRINAFYVFSAGAEGTAERFAKLAPHEGTEVWSDFYGVDGKVAMPSVVFSRNSLGGRVGIVAMSLIRNRASGLYNFRKQEMIGNLLERISPSAIPVKAVDAPGIWLMASVSADGKTMLLMVNNLSGDDRDGVRLAFSGAWRGAKASRLGEDAAPVPCGRAEAVWTVPFALGQMCPEFIMLEKK